LPCLQGKGRKGRDEKSGRKGREREREEGEKEGIAVGGRRTGGRV